MVSAALPATTAGSAEQCIWNVDKPEARLRTGGGQRAACQRAAMVTKALGCLLAREKNGIHVTRLSTVIWSAMYGPFEL